MHLTIKLLKPYSDVVGTNELELDFEGSTLHDLIQVLIELYPKLKNEWFTKDNELTDHLVVFVNDKPASALHEFETRLKNDDELVFFIPMSGG